MRKISNPSTKPLTPTFLTREDPSPALPVEGREWLPLFAMLSCDLGIVEITIYSPPFMGGVRGWVSLPHHGGRVGVRGCFLFIQLRIRNPRMIHTLELVDEYALGGGDVAESDRTFAEIAVSHHTVDEAVYEGGNALFGVFLQ